MDFLTSKVFLQKVKESIGHVIGVTTMKRLDKDPFNKIPILGAIPLTLNN